MLQPKRVKYRNKQRGRRKGVAVAGSTMNFCEYCLKATEPAWVTARQIEAARRVITRYTRRGGKFWIRVFPDKSVTARAAETRMGSGKGAVDHWDRLAGAKNQVAAVRVAVRALVFVHVHGAYGEIVVTILAASRR